MTRDEPVSDDPVSDNPAGEVIIVMGVSGSGKTTIARGIAEAMGWVLAEGDDFHSPTNLAKLRSAHPLTDEDRMPWLRAIGAWIDERYGRGENAVITCSALKRVYRDLLRAGRPTVRFCQLTADPALIEDRMERRTGHPMPATLLPSQLDLLEDLQPDEPGQIVSTAGAPEEVLRGALMALGLEPGAG